MRQHTLFYISITAFDLSTKISSLLFHMEGQHLLKKKQRNASHHSEKFIVHYRQPRRSVRISVRRSFLTHPVKQLLPLKSLQQYSRSGSPYVCGFKPPPQTSGTGYPLSSDLKKQNNMVYYFRKHYCNIQDVGGLRKHTSRFQKTCRI